MKKSKVYSFTLPFELGEDFKTRCAIAGVHASKIIQYLLLGIRDYTSDNLKEMHEITRGLNHYYDNLKNVEDDIE